MLVWFIGASLATVWFVFRDPHFAFGWVVAGVLLPDVVEGIAGRVGPLHSVVTIVLLMGVVMLATIGKRGARSGGCGAPAVVLASIGRCARFARGVVATHVLMG